MVLMSVKISVTKETMLLMVFSGLDNYGKRKTDFHWVLDNV